ncbi:MAG: hypothetical protein S4CHLAM2_16140 [Chlamydiales bacterium]|nr:hypothetical protein [Chlamydiales bacterium]
MNVDDHHEKIIKNPENYDEMVTKLKEREDEQLKKVLAKRKAETEDELIDIAGKAIVKRQLRTGEHKSLKDRTVITEPKSPEVAEMRKRLNKEITDLAQRTLRFTPEQPGLSDGSEPSN